MSALLSAVEFHADYGATPIVKGVTLDVCAGEIVALIGANGSGKSTLLRGLMGLAPHTRGAIQFDGTDVSGSGPVALAKRGIAFVPQKRNVFTEMNVQENLVVGGIVLSRSERKRRLEATLDLIPQLKPLLRRNVGELSGGTQKLVALGRALVPNPSTLLLDEPLAGVSAGLTDELLLLFENLRDKERALLIVEHRILTILATCDRAYGLRCGKIVFSGKASDLREDIATLEEIFSL